MNIKSKLRRTISVVLMSLTAVFFLLMTTSCATKQENNAETNDFYKEIQETCQSKDGTGFTDFGDYIIWIDDYKSADIESAVSYSQVVSDNTQGGLCTACVKKNSNGEVLIGRNQDMEISQYPAFIVTTSYGKYKTIGYRYLDGDLYSYEQFKSEGYKNKDYINFVGLFASDCMNSEGLYIQGNAREGGDAFYNTGTNPGKTRVRIDMLATLVAQNCATVKEAVSFIKNELDIYSTPIKDVESFTEIAYLIGDASGDYGIVEIAGNQIYYLPYQNGQANYYLNPTCNAIDDYGSGYGRLASALEGLEEIETQEEMFNQIQKAMWKNWVLYAEYTYIDENGIIHFVDDKGNPTIDWRSDIYISMIEELWGSKELPLSGTCARWRMRPENAEVVVELCKDLFVKHGYKEKLLQYYAGNEQPLRDDGRVMTTGMQFSVNCNKKSAIIRFFEREDLTYKFDVDKILK